MKIKLISCEALCREFSLAVARSPHVIDTEFLPFGLHDTPDKLRKTIQERIDAAQGYDAIILGYGLCSRGTAELTAPSVPLVAFRAHDCITMLLGSRERYSREFTANPGTYYYSPGWIERKEGEVQQGFVADKHNTAYQQRYAEYVEKYGEDNAQFLMEQETQWQAHYNRAALIDMGLGDVEGYRRFTCSVAQSHGWDYAELAGDLSLFERMANGEWESEDFLRVEPGQRITESYDQCVLRAESEIL